MPAGNFSLLINKEDAMGPWLGLIQAAVLYMGAPAQPEIVAAPPALARVSCEPIATNAGQLTQCLVACGAGGETFRSFCRSLPDPKLRAGCWALEFAGEAACKGWCYWHFGE